MHKVRAARGLPKRKGLGDVPCAFITCMCQRILLPHTISPLVPVCGSCCALVRAVQQKMQDWCTLVSVLEFL